MFRNRDSIDRMRIASPCPKNWDGMTGDNRARFCDLCSRHVYNISEMTRKDVEKMIAKTEGRICGRLYKRADGSVITKDCPVGLRAIRRRVSRVAGATITAIFSFCLSVMGQNSAQEDKICSNKAKVTIESSMDSKSIVQGVLKDVNGNSVPGAKVTLTNQSTQEKLETVSYEEGVFRFLAVGVGNFKLEVHAGGFESTVINEIDVRTAQILNVDVEMAITEERVFIGLVALPPFLDTDSHVNKKTFEPKRITSLPY